MDVRLGWSGEIHGTWTKMDVEVSEADLNLVLAENDIDIVTAKIKVVEKFKLMYILAEIFVQLHKMSRFPERFGQEDDKKELSDLMSARDKLINSFKERNDRAPF